MKRACGLVIAALVVALTAGASPAHAAKGVKKKGGDNKIHGTVVAVHYHKGGHGSITVKVHHHHKKKGTQAAALQTTPQLPATPKIRTAKLRTTAKLPTAPQSALPAGATPHHHHHHHTFTVSLQTKFESVRGKERERTSFASVHKGEHVEILAKGHHADEVEIFHHHKTTPKVKKKA